MKFIMKHTEGPWVVNKDSKCGGIESELSGHIICECIYDPDDENLISQSPAMRDYMIKRAEKLNYWIENKQLIRNGSREELSRIIEILKAAGVEVAE